MKLTAAQAWALVDRLELDVDDSGVCKACLCFVAFALDTGDEADVRRQTFALAEAIAEIDVCGHRSAVVRPIVRRLGEQLLAAIRLPPPAPVVPLRRR